MMRHSVLPFALCVFLPGLTCQGVSSEGSPRSQEKEAQEQESQQEKPAPEPQKDARAQVLELLAEQGITIDAEKKQVRAEGKINVTADYLEFVAIGPRGKKHEALVMLRCLGSSLNTAFALLGLKPGKNVDYEKIEPMPTQEEVERGAPTVKIIPPQGPQIWMAVAWKDAEGKRIVHAVEDLILDVREDKTLQGTEWIYFGGRMTSLYRGEPPVYIADYEQNYVSTYYVKPDNQLITIRHERGNYDDNWWPNEHLLPARGTECELIFGLAPIVERLPLEKAYPNSGKPRPVPGEGVDPQGGGEGPRVGGGKDDGGR